MKTHCLRLRLLTSGLLALTLPGLAAPAGGLLPNPGFEVGTNRPAGWHSSDPEAQWSSQARHGRRSLAVQGNGRNSAAWRTDPLALTPGGLYRLSFQARQTPNTTGGCAVSGTGLVNRDFRLTEDWREYGFVLAVPSQVSNDYVRLGQWEVKGQLQFDDAQLRPVRVAYASYGSGSLGEGESIRGGLYRFSAHYGGSGANFHRPLWLNRCGFNSDRWTFSSGSEVIYRQGVADATQTGAVVRLNLNYHVAGALQVEARRDGGAWLPVGRFDGTRRSGTNALPAGLFPATNVFVRLLATGPNANFQVDAYDYSAPLGEPGRDALGRTHFLEVLADTGELAVGWHGLRLDGEESFTRWVPFWITNVAGLAGPLRLALAVDGRAQGPERTIALGAPQAGGGFHYGVCELDLPGRHEITASVLDPAGRTLFSGRTETLLSPLAEPRAGHWAGGSEAMDLWWCESGWKLARAKHWPARPKDRRPVPLEVRAARGEFEPVQLFVRPSVQAANLTAVRVSSLANAQGTPAGITARVDQIEYVQVTRPTDPTCVAGWYPDPLPPLHTPVAVAAGMNCPLWITFHVPPETPAGDYAGWIELETTVGRMNAPVKVHVYDFALPAETHLRSGLGLGTEFINRYHQLKTPADRQKVYDLYLRNFAEHRISPYSFFEYAPIDVRFVGQGSNKQARVDFSQFDAAATRWLDQERFSSFCLPLRGMGGGTFQSRSLGRLEGFEEGTPEHARLFQDYLSQVQRHLRERGWLDKAYTYWFDEPDEKDYEFVVAGMKRIKAAAPGLRRLLTEQPEPALLGNVEIWCGLTPEWTPEKVRARRAAGEEVWWYICCGPVAPYITEFIDHPATELRLWPWQSWQYGVQGLLIWATTYWTSAAAFPGASAQDPWEDPMSYVSGYDFKPGHIGYWGNGDGRFLYPPREALGSETPCLEGPVNSLRWENLRDGLEDYEYFWLLEQAIAQAANRNAPAGLLAEARRLLRVPPEVSTDLTHFTTDPRPLLAQRERLAAMIERLQALGR